MKPKKFKSAAEKKAKKSLKKDWADLKKRVDSMSLGGTALATSVPAPKKSVVDPILAVLAFNADRLASNL